MSYPCRWCLAFFIQCEILPTRPCPALRRHYQVFESWLWHQRASWESRTSPGEWSQEEPAHIWALTVIFSQLANKRPLNECEYETPGGARSCVFTAEPSEIGCHFRLPDPRGKALRTEMQSVTHHRQNGWDSAINDAAALSVLL